MTIDPDTASLDQLRDECAVLLGWTQRDGDIWTRPNGDDRGYSSRMHNPCPATLDFVAGAIPRGWYVRIEHDDGGEHWWLAEAWTQRDDRVITEADTELTARYRLLAKVLRHEKEGTR